MTREQLDPNDDYSGDIARLYELVHRGKGKDYGAEARDVSRIVLEHAPHAASLLDVGCGTGAHLSYLAQTFSVTEGLELSTDMLRIAQANNQGLDIHAGDMRNFDLSRRFDAITCMFSSIGHMADEGELTSAFQSFARNLRTGGIVLVEPWWFPESFTPGWISTDTVKVDDTTIVRMSHSVEDSGATAIEVHYLEATPTQGIRHHLEKHRITLFTREQYESAFADAGLTVHLLEDWPSGRGLFVAMASP